MMPTSPKKKQLPISYTWLDKTIWPMIYIGILLLALGISYARVAHHDGWNVAEIIGGLVIVFGLLLLFIRPNLKKL